MDYESKYNKYKKKYTDTLETYMDIEDIKLVKKYIECLPHYTTYENFKNIMKTGMLFHSNQFDVVMVSVFLKPFPQGAVYDDDYDNNYTEKFYNGMCMEHDNIILLFDPKMLYHELYYYFSSFDNYGMIHEDQYVSKGIKNKIVTPLTPKIVKKIQSKYDKILTDRLITVLEEIIADDLPWPEIGFYLPLSIKKYLTGIIVPEKYKNEIQTYIKGIDLTIYICGDNGIHLSPKTENSQ